MIGDVLESTHFRRRLRAISSKFNRLAERPTWPLDGLEQMSLRDLLAKALAPTPPDAIASVLNDRNIPKRRERFAELPETLVATGLALSDEYGGQRKYFLPS